MLEHPWVNLSISIEGQWLFFLLSNSRPDEIHLSRHPLHIGLNNVKKRLQLLYPGTHDLDIAETNRSFEVFMKIRLEDNLLVEKDATAENIKYAMA
jgi:LytS/YehU family sensor histidine kinase